MNKNETLQYNLSVISNIDRELSSNNEKRKSLIDKYKKRIKIYNIIRKLSTNLFKSVLIFIITILTIYNFGTSVVTVLISLGIILISNLLITGIVCLLKPKKNYYEKLEKYNSVKTNLLQKRNTYINLYRYTLDENKALIHNIKSKINNDRYYEYDKYINSEWINNDRYALNKLLEMKNKEYSLVKNIKSTIYYEINSDIKTQGLSSEQLKFIADSIEQY